MKKLLLISSLEKSREAVLQLLKAEYDTEPESAHTAAEGRRKALEKRYDAIIITSPLRDESADKLSTELAERTTSGIMLIVSADAEEATEQRVMQYGVFVLAKPLGKAMFLKALRLLEAAEYRMQRIQQENEELRQQMDETRIISRAKSVLIRYLSMTEPQAHRYLEKQAMDLRITKLEAARRLLSTYDY